MSASRLEIKTVDMHLERRQLSIVLSKKHDLTITLQATLLVSI